MNIERDKYSGLYNRAYGLALLERTLTKAKQQGTTVAILLTDFDRYKVWNDEYGHSYGDIMLRQLAKVVQDIVSSNGTICRFGGDEFLIILPSIFVNEAKNLAEKICMKVSHQKIDIKEKNVPSVTMTIGIALYPTNGQDVNSLLRAVEDAIQQGKLTGQGTINIV